MKSRRSQLRMEKTISVLTKNFVCPFKEDHQSKAINALPSAPLKGTRSGKSFYKCDVLTESTDSNNVSSSLLDHKELDQDMIDNTLGVLEPIEREMPVQVTGSSCDEENLEPSKSSDLGSERVRIETREWLKILMKAVCFIERNVSFAKSGSY